ncbi:hypothetical protein [Labedella endophytica]|uniref:hypothetical protein n=1 Tax=Labedella endophytica TaxID=1523160 RepID=UPI00140BD944|nr:hypothetical protein [Labedella endophytica]
MTRDARNVAHAAFSRRARRARLARDEPGWRATSPLGLGVYSAVPRLVLGLFVIRHSAARSALQFVVGAAARATAPTNTCRATGERGAKRGSGAADGAPQGAEAAG